MPTGRVMVMATAPPRTYSFGIGLVDLYDNQPRLTIHPWGAGSALVVQRVCE